MGASGRLGSHLGRLGPHFGPKALTQRRPHKRTKKRLKNRVQKQGDGGRELECGDQVKQPIPRKPWQHVCWITPGKLCLGSLLGNYVLHQPLETVCCQLWSSAFGSPVLVPGFGPTGPMAHGPLGQDVLHHVWHTMCCISAWKLCVASPLGDDGGV